MTARCYPMPGGALQRCSSRLSLFRQQDLGRPAADRPPPSTQRSSSPLVMPLLFSSQIAELALFNDLRMKLIVLARRTAFYRPDDFIGPFICVNIRRFSVSTGMPMSFWTSFLIFSSSPPIPLLLNSSVKMMKISRFL